MTDEVNERAVIGDNNPPPPAAPFDQAVVDKLSKDGEAFLEGAAIWVENGAIETADEAERLGDFITGIKARVKKVEEERVKAKKPHDDAGKLVQAAFKPLAAKVTKALEKVEPLATAWLEKLQAEKDAEVARLAEEARVAQAEAEEKARAAAARNDISGEVEAEEALKEAAEIQKSSARLEKSRVNVGSATGGGRKISMRDVIEVKVTNANQLFMRYREREEVTECLRNLAAREARQASFNVKTDKIPGAEITTTKKAV